LKEDKPEVRVRAAFWELVAAGLSIVVNLITLMEKTHKHRKIIRRFASRLVNPRVLGIVLAIPSFMIAVATSNQLITNQASWGSLTAQIMVLSMLGLAMTAPVIFTPYRKRARDSYIKFNPS
jgi:hypothetical protein